MYRKAMAELYKWKDNPNRKPLIIEGARQVGKTWLMNEFGRLAYKQTAYVNFVSNPVMKELFERDFDPSRLISGLELYTGKTITPADTLIILDEVQEVPRALTSLKYFCENAPEYSIICAGSLLGLALHQGTSFPVGKVNMIRLYPMTFSEFLIATDRKRYANLIEKQDFAMITAFKQTYIEALRQYYFVGGMPEAVASFSVNQNYGEIRTIQNAILNSYDHDISKHAPIETVPRIRMVLNSIPSQFARENKKFVYRMIRPGSRAKDYETAIMWLSDCGLIHKINCVNAGSIPLKAYENANIFKIFIMDVGILGALAGLNQKTLIDGNELFVEFKGALTEQFVCQQLETIENLRIYYYASPRSTCEIDFMIDTGDLAVPVEVKAETNLKAKNLQTYRSKYNPETAIRLSLADYKKEEGLINLPLYAVEEINRLK